MNTRWWMAGLLVVALLAGLAIACDLGGVTLPGATPEGEETLEPGETPEAAETPEEETPEEEVPFTLEESTLNDLDSYAYHFEMSYSGITEGELEEGTLETEGEVQNSPTQARHVIFRSSTDGEVTYMEWIYIEEEAKMWTLSEEGGEWMEIPAEDPEMASMFDAFTLLGVWSAFSGEAEGTDFVGLEVVNGIPSRHYSAHTFAGIAAECTWTTAEQDWWVAVDGNYPVKGIMDAGGTCEGESGEFHLIEEISEVNQAQDIESPM